MKDEEFREQKWVWRAFRGTAGLTSVKGEKEEGRLGWKSHRVQALAHLRLVI